MSDSLRASGRLSVAIFGSRILGLLREVVFAALFGAGWIADAYQIAFRIPNLLRDLLAEGALSSAFVPTFTDALRNDGEQRAYALGNLVMSVMLILTGGLTALGVIFAPQIVAAISGGFGDDPKRFALATELTRIMMPILALVSLGAVWSGMLNAQRRFGVPALGPALFNVVSIVAGIVVWWLYEDARKGILAWSWGTLASGAAQALLQVVVLARMRYRPRLLVRGAWRSPGLRRIALLMAPATIGLAAVQLNVFVNTRFAASLEPGAVAELSYAFRLFFLPLGMFGVALGTVTTTSVSEAAADRDVTSLGDRVAGSLRAGWMLTSASAVGLGVLAYPIVMVVYRHGAMSMSAAEGIVLVLQAYVIGLVPYSLVKILAPGFYSLDRPRVPLLASMAGVVTNITFNALTYERLGAPGIALGTSLGAFVNATILRTWLGRMVPTPSLGARNILVLLVANLAMGGILWVGWWAFATGLAAASISGWAWMLAVAGALLLLIALGFVVYAGLLRLLRFPDGAALWALPSKIFRRLRRS